MTPAFSCLGINSKNLGGGSVLSLRLSFKFLSVLYHIFPVVWLQPVSIGNIIHCIIYYMLQDVLWTSFPVLEEGQDRLDMEMFWKPWLLFLCHGLILFHNQCMWGRAHAFWSSCPPYPYQFILTSLITDITSPCKTCLSLILGHLQMQQEQQRSLGYAVLMDQIGLFSSTGYLGFTVVLEVWPCAFAWDRVECFPKHVKGSCSSIVPWIYNTGLNILTWYFKIHNKPPDKNVCINCGTRPHEGERERAWASVTSLIV